MVDMPTKMMPKPMMIEASSLMRSRLDKSRINAPTAMHSGANDVGLISAISVDWLEMSPRRRIWPVIVVPMFAPIITATPCVSRMMPALTKPTTMTDVAEELWMTAVTTAPSNTPLKRLFVSFSRVFFASSRTVSRREMKPRSFPSAAT